MSDFRRGPLLLLTWLALATVVYAMLQERSAGRTYVGMVSDATYEISTSATGVLAAVVIDRFDQVQAGDVVARLDSTDLEAEIRTARARITQLQSELAGVEQQLRASAATEALGRLAELRRFQIDETNLRLDALALKVTLESDRIAHARLMQQLARKRQLAGTGDVPTAEFDDLALESQEVARRIELNEALLQTADQEYGDAQARRATFEQRIPETPEMEALLSSVRDAVTVEEARLLELELTRRSLLLRSPIAVCVVEMTARRGQALLAGQPVAFVVPDEPAEIVCYVSGARSGWPELGAPALVVPGDDQTAAAQTSVIRIGPSIVPLPQRLWRDTTTPEYGLPIILAPVPGLQLPRGAPVAVQIPD
ncbi:MAG: HlyD family secretion protein [Phycisphaerales bacterium JB038]